jgi:hypothetical protein
VAFYEENTECSVGVSSMPSDRIVAFFEPSQKQKPHNSVKTFATAKYRNFSSTFTPGATKTSEKNMQNEPFEPGASQPQKELAIKKGNKQQLSKKQTEFNRLVKKLEKARAKLHQKTEKLNEGLKYFGTHIHPLEQKLTGLRITCVKTLYTFYKEPKLLSKSNKKLLKEMIGGSLNNIFSLLPGKPDKELKDIFTDVTGISYDQMEKERFEEMKWEMEELFETMGVNINLDDLDVGMSEEEIARKMAEMQEEMNKQKEAPGKKKGPGKKTQKQLEYEERQQKLDEARKKNIGGIYKQLAKTFHPDLEADSELKQQKEELMKQLTVAYEKNDLHTLLKLEMEWIKKEEGNIDDLTDDKLGIYNEVLREQVGQCEMEMEELLSHPRYTPLERFSESLSGLSPDRLKKQAAFLNILIEHTGNDVENLQGGSPLEYIKEMIKEYKTLPKDQGLDMDDLLYELMKYRR